MNSEEPYEHVWIGGPNGHWNDEAEYWRRYPSWTFTKVLRESESIRYRSLDVQAKLRISGSWSPRTRRYRPQVWDAYLELGRRHQHVDSGYCKSLLSAQRSAEVVLRRNIDTFLALVYQSAAATAVYRFEPRHPNIYDHVRAGDGDMRKVLQEDPENWTPWRSDFGLVVDTVWTEHYGDPDWEGTFLQVENREKGLHGSMVTRMNHSTVWRDDAAVQQLVNQLGSWLPECLASSGPSRGLPAARKIVPGRIQELDLELL